MKLVFKSNNLVEISWVKYVLDSNDIEFFVLDELMSINEGNISAENKNGRQHLKWAKYFYLKREIRCFNQACI